MKAKYSRTRGLTVTALASGLALAVAGAEAGGFPDAPLRRCAPDAVVAGTACLDRYEETVWRIHQPTTTNASLVRRIQLGRVTRDDLLAGGAIQLGVDVDYDPCRKDGQNCAGDIYAVSLPGETPANRITWFQAQEACANSGKRLPTNAEWQVGANGTPDTGQDDGQTECNVGSLEPVPTGSRRECVSARSASDMVGNLAEWVADWVPQATACPTWGNFSDDVMCLAGASTVAPGPGALVRGGAYSSTTFGGAGAGPLTVVAQFSPAISAPFIGFRCAR